MLFHTEISFPTLVMALTGVHLSVALIACLMVVQVTAASASDPCHLPATKESVWFGLPSQVKSCFDAIPFSESTRKSTMKIMERVMSLYSFSDIVQAGLSPYLLNVRPLFPLFWPSRCFF